MPALCTVWGWCRGRVALTSRAPPARQCPLPHVPLVVAAYLQRNRFCRDHHFTHEKTSTLASIMSVVVKQDRFGGLTTMEASFDRFKRLLMCHCVERVPTSTYVFDVEDITNIVDYVANT